MDRFSPRHFAFLILATTIVSLKTYPAIYIRDGGRESWVAMIIASGLILAFFVYVLKIISKTKCFSLYKIYTTSLGKTLGKVFIGLFIITLLITLIESAAVEANSMHTNMLLEAPIWYLLLFFIAPALYTVRKDLVAVITVTLIGIVLIFIAGINLSILTARYKHFFYLFPVFNEGIRLGFIACLLKILGLYGCVTITLPYISKVIDDKNSLVKSSIVGLILVIQMQIVSATGLLMTFQPEQLNSLSYPKLLQTQQVSYLRFLEFGELYVMLQILGGWLLKYVVTFYGLLILLKEFNLKRKTLIILSYIISAIVFVCAYFVSDNLFILFKLLHYYSYICLINLVIIPIIVFTIFSIKSKNNKAINNSQ
jgi:spore germination protein (amino acid permease)